jgi:hypothetical protein
MTTSSSRIQLINNFKPLHISQKRPIDNRINKSGISLLMNSISLLLFLGYGFTNIILDVIGIDDFLIWDKTGLIVILFIINTVNFQKKVYQYILLKHLRFLKQNSDHFIEWEINENLQKIINQLNNPFTSKVAVITAITILIFTPLNYAVNANLEFGNYLKIPFIIYTIYFFKLFWNNYNQLIENLIHVEIS